MKIDNIYIGDDVAKRIHDNKLEIDISLEDGDIREVHIQPYDRAYDSYLLLKFQVDEMRRKIDELIEKMETPMTIHNTWTENFK